VRRRLLVLLLASAVPWIQVRIDASSGFRAQEEILYLWSGEQVRRLCPGFEALMADIYWIRTVQYFGGQRAFAQEKRFDLLEPLVNITTTLDPKLEIAYRYGAVFLSEARPFGAGRPEAGIALLERGAQQLPRSWILQQNLGFYTYFYLRDPHRAAAAVLKAARLPGAPVWLENMAADFLVKGGERETARRIWMRMYEQSEEGPIKANARSQLQRLDALEGADILTRQVRVFVAKTGRLPGSLAELGRAGLLPFPPNDPTGIPFEYRADTGKVEIARGSQLWRVPGPLGSGYQ